RQPQRPKAFAGARAGVRVRVRLGQSTVVEQEDDQPDEHADAGRGEGRVPTDQRPAGSDGRRVAVEIVPDQGGNEVADEGADVDAHVEDVVTRVAQFAPRRVEVPQ